MSKEELFYIRLFVMRRITLQQLRKFLNYVRVSA